MRALDLKKGNKIMYVKKEMMAGAYNKGQISIINSTEFSSNHVSIGNGMFGIPLKGLCENYKFIKEDNSLEDITLSLDINDYILEIKNICWTAYINGSGNKRYNGKPNNELDIHDEGLIFNIVCPELTPEEIFNKDKAINSYKFKDSDEQTLTFETLPKQIRDNYIINNMVYHAFFDLWDKIFTEKSLTDKTDFIIEGIFIADNCYKFGAGKKYETKSTETSLQDLRKIVENYLIDDNTNNFYTLMYKKFETLWNDLLK